MTPRPAVAVAAGSRRVSSRSEETFSRPRIPGLPSGLKPLTADELEAEERRIEEAPGRGEAAFGDEGLIAHHREIGDELLAFNDIASLVIEAMPEKTLPGLRRLFVLSTKLGAFPVPGTGLGPRDTVRDLFDLFHLRAPDLDFTPTLWMVEATDGDARPPLGLAAVAQITRIAGASDVVTRSDGRTSTGAGAIAGTRGSPGWETRAPDSKKTRDEFLYWLKEQGITPGQDITWPQIHHQAQTACHKNTKGLSPVQLPLAAPHRGLALDQGRRRPEAAPDMNGALDDQHDLRRLWRLVRRSRRRPGKAGEVGTGASGRSLIPLTKTGNYKGHCIEDQRPILSRRCAAEPMASKSNYWEYSRR